MTRQTTIMSEPRPGTKRVEIKELIHQVGFTVLGQRIRRIRSVRGLTIRELAAKAEVSKNTLLRLEKGEPTHISTVAQLCRALKVTPQQLTSQEFIEPSVVAVHRKEHDVWFNMNAFTSVMQPSLTPEERARAPQDPAITPFCLIRSRLGDGVFNPNVIELFHPTPRRSHRGYEFMYVLEGASRVVINTDEYVLTAGESICFWASEEHHYEPVGEDSVRVLSIVVDPLPGAQISPAFPPREPRGE